MDEQKDLLARRTKENARKAKEVADQLYPGEKWIQKDEYGKRIFVSPCRKTGSKSNFNEELRDAQILRDLGSTVYLTPEDNRQSGRKYDAIVDGMIMEFKNMSGKSEDTLIDHFYSSRRQAPNVFINLENSPLSKHKIISTLIGARNSPKFDQINLFPEGGIITLKIKGHSDVVYLNVNDL